MKRLTKFILTLILLTGTATLVAAQDKEQNAAISGYVIESATGKPIPTAQVRILGVASAITDESGMFKITKYFDGATLMVSAPGYATRQVTLKPGKTLKIALMDDSYKGSYEDILMPFEMANARQSTYALSTHENREDYKLTATSVEAILQGSAAGLNAVMRNGSPGAGANLFLNGFNTVNTSTQPLIVVDGIPFNNETVYSLVSGNAISPLSDIDVKDIDQITVIKDGSSVYGSKAANGVILIRTLRARGVATRIDFHSYLGINLEPSSKYPVMNAWDYRSYLTDLLKSKGMTANEIHALPYMNDEVPVIERWGVSGNSDYYRYHQETDWQGEVYRPSLNQNYHLSVTGGNENALYAISFGYLGHGGVIENTDFERYTTRVNAEIKMTEWFQLNPSMSFVYSSRNVAFGGDNRNFNPVYAALIKAPFMSPYVYNVLGEETPNLEDYDVFNVSNPLALTRETNAKNSRFRFFGLMNGVLTFNKNLNANLTFGLTADQASERVFLPDAGVYHTTLPSAIIWNESQQMRNHLMETSSEIRLNYQKNLENNQNLRAHLGFRYRTNELELDWGKAYNTSSDEMKTLGDGMDELAKMGGSLGAWRSVSNYLNAEYNWKDRFYLSANAALDGSSRFGDKADGLKLFNQVFGFFPSINGAWMLHTEDFMSELESIDLLKLRAGYSVTENDDIGNYSARLYYTPQPLLGAYGLVRGNIPNPTLKWETNRKLSAGIDLSALNERVNLSLDLYTSTTSDLIQINKLDSYAGIGTSITNDGKLQNKGWDLSIQGRVMDRSDLKWDLGLQLYAYKNTLLEMSKDEFQTEMYGGTVRTKVGQPLSQFWGYKTNGIFTTADEASTAGLKMVQPDGTVIPFEAGDVIFDDVDENSIINSLDKQVIGDPNPDLLGSIRNDVQWDRFRLSALLTYSLGGDVYNAMRANLESMSNTDNQSIAAIYRWRTDGQETSVPKATWGDPKGNARFSDRWIEDGSYLKLKNISLSYDLNIREGQIRSAQVYVSASNLLTFSKYLGNDPEFSVSQSPLAYGIDNGVTSQPRSIMLGIKIGL